MARRLMAAAVTGVLLASLVACGGEDGPSGLPTLDPNATQSSSPGATGTPSSPTSAPTSPPVGPASKTIGVHPRKIVTKDATQKAVADAFVNYITVRLTAYNTNEVDLDELAKVAAGKALNQVREQVAQNKAEKQHTIGEVWVDIPAVTVKGASATLRSCMDNTTIDVDSKDKPVEPPVPYLLADATLQKVDGTTWVVSTVSFGEKRC